MTIRVFSISLVGLFIVGCIAAILLSRPVNAVGDLTSTLALIRAQATLSNNTQPDFESLITGSEITKEARIEAAKKAIKQHILPVDFASLITGSEITREARIEAAKKYATLISSNTASNNTGQSDNQTSGADETAFTEGTTETSTEESSGSGEGISGCESLGTC